MFPSIGTSGMWRPNIIRAQNKNEPPNYWWCSTVIEERCRSPDRLHTWIELSGCKPILTLSVNNILGHWSRVQFSSALAHLARTPLCLGLSPGVLCGLQANNPMSCGVLCTLWLLTATPMALHNPWRRVVAEIVGFLRADITYWPRTGAILHGCPSWGQSATDWMSWSFLHSLETTLWLTWRMLATSTWFMFCSIKVIILMWSATERVLRHCTALGSIQTLSELGSD